MLAGCLFSVPFVKALLHEGSLITSTVAPPSGKNDADELPASFDNDKVLDDLPNMESDKVLDDVPNTESDSSDESITDIGAVAHGSNQALDDVPKAIAGTPSVSDDEIEIQQKLTWEISMQGWT